MSHHTGAENRSHAIHEVRNRVPRKFEWPTDSKGHPLRVTAIFGKNTFDLHKIKDRIPKAPYEKLANAVHLGGKLDKDVADAVAKAVRDWSIEMGATHFCHWFQPQTGLTAEKHDSFLAFDDQQMPIEKFSGAMLVQSEPDASSFPSGGMRTTFEARGYTAWDPSVPMFIMESANTKTLCIPSCFISYHGHALDKKTALLRSTDALSKAACDLLEVIGVKGTDRVVSTLGVEQEYFLLDRAFYTLRPDLVMTGRTLVGGQPPKGQQLEDHYFGSIPSRVVAYMAEVEFELYKLGVPLKTRHNEVAPSQFECAPIFEEANTAIDHNQLVMETLKKVARRHNYEALMHEKPFAGLNGSGKHANWSMSIVSSNADHGSNLLERGKTPHQNLRFLLFLMATLKGVHKHAGLLRAGIASSGNDHRLGANEAPPAIISVFMGDLLNRIIDEIDKGTGASQGADAVLKLGVSKLPEIMKDNTDRNRTSPFAFTGNKFEFRAVGASSSPAIPVTFLNAAVAEALIEIKRTLESKLAQKKNLETAALEVMQEAARETRSIRFEGNNYSQEWQKEAEKRGLLNLRTTPKALKQMLDPKSKQLLTSLGIYSESELHSRFVVRTERYIKNLMIEVDTLCQMVDATIMPACFAYHASLSAGLANAKAAGVFAPQAEVLNRLNTLITSLQSKRTAFNSSIEKCNGIEHEDAKAEFLADKIAPEMAEIRTVCDDLEGIVGDTFWPLPKYREMLFLA